MAKEKDANPIPYTGTTYTAERAANLWVMKTVRIENGIVVSVKNTQQDVKQLIMSKLIAVFNKD